MKVILLSFMWGEAGGGSAAVPQMIATALRDKGIEVVVITTQPRAGMTVDRQTGIKFYRFRPPNLYWIGDKDKQHPLLKVLWQLIDIWNPFVYSTVKDILVKEQPDVVHVHKLRGLSPSVWRAARHAGCSRILYTAHDYELMSPEGTLTGRLGKWASQGMWLLRPYQWLRAIFSQNVHAVTAPSRYTLEMLTDRRFFPNAQSQVVYNSHGWQRRALQQLRIQVETKRRSSENQTDLHLLYLGRLERNKGVDILCGAFVQASKKVSNLRLSVAGYGTMADSLVTQYGDHPRITFHGPLFGEAKAELLTDSDLVVLPSVWAENAPVVIPEAYAYGNPCIVAEIGGLPEFVTENETGYLVPSGDVSALVVLFEQLAANPEQIAKMRANCYRRAEDFSVQAIIQAYLELYEAKDR